MSRAFRIGDKVVCINNENAGDDLIIGKIYTITALGNFDEKTPSVGVDNKNDQFEQYFVYRFKLANSEILKKRLGLTDET